MNADSSSTDAMPAEGAAASVPWSLGRWTHTPARVRQEGDQLHVEAVEGSDAWRHTSYGFVHDSEHALVAPLSVGQAVEVEFTADYSQQFDQAGVFIRASERHWVKAGVEYSDGALQVGAVVTDEYSDWSVAAVPEWHGNLVVVRVSRHEDCLLVRAARQGEQLRLVRVVPFRCDTLVEAGPYVCAPSRAGLTVVFHDWRVGKADTSLH